MLSLLLVAAQAATAITSERDTGALDLLLVTDLTPQEFIFGKLGGIAYNTKEYLLPPLLLAAVYAFYGCLATPPAGPSGAAGAMNATSLVCVAGAGSCCWPSRWCWAFTSPADAQQPGGHHQYAEHHLLSVGGHADLHCV